MTHKLKSFAKLALPVIAGAFAFASSPTAQASVLINESFTGDDGTLPANWTRPSGITAPYASIQDNRLRLVRTSGASSAAPNNSGQVAYYTGTGLDGSLTNGQIADLSASVTVSHGGIFASNTSFGMVIRDNNTSFGVTNGYYIAILNDNTFGIWTNIGTNNVNVTVANALDNVTVGLALDTDYILEVLAVGSNISASLWAVDVNGDKTGTALGEISIDNAATGAGYLGLRMGPGNTNQYTYFDNLRVEAIPEPSTALLLLPAAALLVYRKRRAAAQK